jgi:transcriptional regulator with XRE-family HTH domain
MMTFGQNLKRLRTKKYTPAMTQTEVEIAGDMALGILSQFETDAREPSLRNLKKIKSGLGCTWEDLFNFEAD